MVYLQPSRESLNNTNCCILLGERDGARVRAAHPVAVALPARGPPPRRRGQAGRRQLAGLRGRGGVLPHRRVPGE